MLKIQRDAVLEQYGVTLISAVSKDAAKYLSYISAADGERIKDLLPCSVVLVNESPHRLLATAVTWSWKDLELGTTHPYSTVAIEDFNDIPDSTVWPGQGRLYTPNQNLNLYLIRQKTAPVPISGPQIRTPEPNVTESSIAQSLTEASQHEQYSAAIDCIVMEDVGPLGPDYADMKSKGWNRSLTFNNFRGGKK
jgi:hypothetical protein